MVDERVNRKMSAILSADVKGYSLLMSVDEEGTFKALNDCREIIARCVDANRGRIVDSPGDNVLAEFVSTVEAVKCAVKIQKDLKTRNAELPERSRMEFRIGINLGDVIEEDDRIYGEGVNIAARLEGLAKAGGICISGTAFDQVKSKLEVGYQYLGEHSVKNIKEPVRAYKILMEPDAAGKIIGEKRKSKSWMPIAAAVIILAGLAGWYLYFEQSKRVEPASLKKMAFPLPEKPSLAVLPFDNLSGDSSQDYLSDGFTETIITELSKLSNLFVIARKSTFTYKGKPVKVQQVAEELGVRYVLEGSVQKSGDRVRITAQLIDALKGHHLWAENYDRKFGNIFVLQDDITEHVVTAMEVKLTEGEQGRIRRGYTDNPQAYEYYLRGLETYRSFTKENNDQARKLYEKAAELDPNYAFGWCSIGWTYYRDGRFGWTDNPDKSLALAEELGRKALTLDESMSEAYSLLSVVYMAKRQHDKAVTYAEKSISLAPNFASNLATVALPYLYSGEPDVAIELVQTAMRHSPYYPSWYLPILGLAYRLTGQYDQAIDALENWRTRANPRASLPHIFLAHTYVEVGRVGDAQIAVEEILKRNPKASIKGYTKSNLFPYKDPAEIERVLASLRKAGLPE